MGKTGLGPGTWVRCEKCVHIYVQIHSTLGAGCAGKVGN